MTRTGMRPPRSRQAGARGLLAGLLSVGLLLLGLALPTAASADTKPATGVPATLAADGLPSLQIDGVVWSMVTWNNIVYATGSFKTARPAGAAAGTSTTPRANLVAFNLTTGAMTSFNHTLSAQGRFLTFSPDHSRLYVAGDFSTVDGVVHNHIAAFDVATGALINSFNPSVNGSVWSLAATASTVYAGGNFTTASGVTHTRLAAFSASTGAVVPTFTLGADYPVRSLLIAPGGGRLILAGDFLNITGPAAGATTAANALASTDLTGGSLATWNLGVTNGGAGSGLYSLSTDGTNLYATAWGYTVGNLEGTIALNPATLGLVWMNDCHGDGYGTYPMGDVIYEVGHTHDCETSYSFPDTNPRIEKFAVAMTSVAKQTLRPTTQGPRYISWTGNPAPDELDWYPDFQPGTYTGQNQSGWALAGSGKYMAYAGEFTSVNGVKQQGIVRFATTDVAPNKTGPVLNTSQMRPSGLALKAHQITVNWPSTWDRDNTTLRYDLYRNGGTTPIYTVTADTLWWKLPTMSFVDTSPGAAGSSVKYTVKATDPFGNSVTSVASPAAIVPATDSAYGNGVLADGPAQFWRFSESSGVTTAIDYAGPRNLTLGAGVARTGSGATPDGGAITPNGTASGLAVTAGTVPTPLTAFSVEGWVKTASTAGGVIVGMGDSPTGANTLSDRDLYIDSGGHASFGIPLPVVTLQPGGTYTVTWVYRAVRSALPVNDGQWHHLVATLGAGGTTLYVDGTVNDTNAAMTTADPYLAGYWQVGTGVLTGLPNAPTSNALSGTVDEVAVYPATLSAAQVAGHWTASGRSAPQPVAQANLTATPTGLTVNVDGSASLPGVPTGSITSYSWNWGDGTPAGSGVTTSHAYAAGGTYTITLTVIDDGGRTATATQPVTVANPTNAAPTAAFTPTTNQRTVSVDGSASADPDGSISSYSWNWGDKTPAGTGPTATHTYGGDGTYTITLTVTDNDGATGVVTHQVTASLPQTTAFVDDIFDRTTTTGWGTATLGGPWTVTGSAKNLSVSPGTGTSKQAAAGSLNRVSLNNVSVTSADVTTAFSLDQIPTGGGAIVAVQGRAAAGQEYQVRIRFLNTGQIKVAITRHDSVANGEWLIGSEVALPTPYTAGTPLNVRLQVYGTSPTTLKAKVWTGATEPTAWTVSQSDSTAALQVPGSVGLSTYLSGSATVFPVTLSFTRYTARPVA